MKPQAFLILAHKNPAQLERLVNYLAGSEADVFVHVDKKSRREFADFISRYEKHPSIHVYSVYKVYWGSYRQILATFLLLEKALQHSGFVHVSLISGQDLPIKPLREFSAFLSSNKDKDFVWIKPLDESTWEAGGHDRMRLHWFINFPPRLGLLFNKLNVILHFFQHRLKLYKTVPFKTYGGDNWFTLSRPTAEKVFTAFGDEYKGYFRHTRCADEMVVPSILVNRKLNERQVNNSLRLIDWHSGPEYPRTFRMCDFDRIKSCEDAFFARKFDERTDAGIIARIYAELLNE